MCRVRVKGCVSRSGKDGSRKRNRGEDKITANQGKRPVVSSVKERVR